MKNLDPSELAAFQERGRLAAAAYEATLLELRGIASACCPIETLSRLGLKALTSQHGFGTEQFNPEIEVYHLEIFQALVLACERSGKGDAREDVAIDRVVELINKNAEAFRERELRTLESSATANRRAMMLDQVKTNTQTLRGARHAFQTLRFVDHLCDELDVAFAHEFGCPLSAFVAAIRSSSDRMTLGLRDFQKDQSSWLRCRTVREALNRFGHVNPELSDRYKIELGHLSDETDLERVRAALLSLASRKLSAVFTISPLENLDEDRRKGIEKAFDAISLQFGSLAISDIQSVYLSNPVWMKPLIRLEKSIYLCPNPQSLYAFFLEIVESLISRSPRLAERIPKIKAVWLEKEVARLCRAAFPDGDVYTKVCWVSEGRRYETDTLIVIDNTVLILEAKSGRVSPPARRAAEERLRREIGKLIVEPSTQSYRLRTLIQNTDADLTLVASEGPVTIPCAHIRHIIRANVLFDTIGTLSSHWPQLVEHGFITTEAPVAPTMSVFELETIFDVLSNQIDRLHYIRRREELELNAQYLADEMDLTALYLENQFNIGEAEFDGSSLEIYGMSSKIGRAYASEGRVLGIPIQVERSKLVEAALAELERRRPVGWTRFGYRLCSISKGNQDAVQRMLKRVFDRLKNKKSGSAYCGMTHGPQRRRKAIGIGAYKKIGDNGLRRLIYDISRQTLFESKTEDALVILWEHKYPKDGYNFIAIVLNPTSHEKVAAQPPATNNFAIMTAADWGNLE